MTYTPNYHTTEASLLSMSAAGAVSTNDYLTFTSEYAGITGESISGDTVTLPAGAYLMQASVGFDRTALTDTCEYRIEVGGTLTGSTGRIDSSSGTTTMCVDQAVASFDITTATPVKLKLTSVASSSLVTRSEFSYVLIMRAVR